ncbi:RNI-like protein [Aulographum hederae CBS 113979]|uniref:RNI-like protein n=1 Tax=Aulographum hederae CBS 113979 TaxID=1176131 RepID=A0A6G1H8N2_9PEZI|nr:RNI-like protein [Aulographum hederae CBS 113979]
MQAPKFYLGKRLSYSENLCSVRYVGEVKGTKGQWLGVEWDDPTRGKHSGEHEGVRYFECLNKQPTAASFVRPTRVFDPPRNFIEALREKYASDIPNLKESGIQSMFVTTAPLANKPIVISGKEVEEVGFDKIRKQLAELDALRIVLLDHLRISRPVTDGIARSWNGEGSYDVRDRQWEIKQTCPKITDLDLSYNVFEDWREVASICEELPALKSLRVSGNRFRIVELSAQERTHFTVVFQNIKTLSLEDTLLNWSDISSLALLFSSLTNLSLANNALDSIVSTPLPETLTTLSLEGNNFTTLSSLSSLTILPNLTSLILKQNSISSITPSNTPASSLSLPTFPSLTYLDISSNNLSSWTPINLLPHMFPRLSSLRLSSNPLFNSLTTPDGRSLTADDGYMLAIARLPNVKTLNYSVVTEKERLNSELWYLSLITSSLSLVAGFAEKEKEVKGSHPRYEELVAEYGDRSLTKKDDVGDTGINPNSLAARLVRMTFRFARHCQAEPEEEVETFTLEIPKQTAVYTVLGLVGKQLNLRPLELRLVWETNGMDLAAEMEALGLDDSDFENDSDSDADVDTSSRSIDDVNTALEALTLDRGSRKKERKGVREVVILHGTRAIGSWVEGEAAEIRVELVK